MASPLTPARAAMLVIQAKDGDWNDGWLSLSEREAIDRVMLPTQRGAYLTHCQWVLNALADPKDKRIAMLEGHILLACDGLASWLTDNTEEVFEEQAEIDQIRGDLDDAVHER